MSERKLATIQKVREIRPIPGADKIEMVKINDWECVVKKDENFKVEDFGVYFEIDSRLPDRPEFEFMRDRNFKVKTIKLRGQISQGLFMPLSILNDNKKYKEGDDVTEILNVTKIDEDYSEDPSYAKRPMSKFEIAIKNFVMRNKFLKKHIGFIWLSPAKGGFPSDIIPKTDEERVQNLSWIYDHFKGRKFYITQKMDGTSCTMGLHKDEFMVCTRNNKCYSSKKETFLTKIFRKKQKQGIQGSYTEMARKYEIERKLREIYKRTGIEYFIQGEICGGNIQKNKMGLKEKELFVFNVYNVNEKRYLNFNEFISFCFRNELQTVPVVPFKEGEDSRWDLEEYTFEKLMELSESQTYGNGTPAEGIVIREVNNENIGKLGRFSFKVISNKFLLKYKL